MAKEIKCPWCGEVVVKPVVSHKKNNYSTVIERRCAKCNNVMAAYSEAEGDFLKSIRTFKD
jgi:ribosomal protein S27E